MDYDQCDKKFIKMAYISFEFLKFCEFLCFIVLVSWTYVKWLHTEMHAWQKFIFQHF
jgi:hypothetical protein